MRHEPRQGGPAAFEWAAAVGLLYFLAAWLTLPLTTTEGLAQFWPASGVAVGALLVLGRSARVPILVAVATASFVANGLDGRSGVASFAFALGNTGEALLVTALIERWFAGPFVLDRLAAVLGLFAAAAIGTAVWEAATALLLTLASQPEATFVLLWGRLVWSNIAGIVMVAPLLLGVAAAVRSPPPWRELAEGTGVLLLHALITMHAFGLLLGEYGHWMLMVPLTSQLPLLLWLALRCGPLFAAGGTLGLGISTLGSILSGHDRYAGTAFTLTDRVLAAQYAMLAMSFVALAIAALIAERRNAELAARGNEARLKLSIDAGKLGTWELDPESGAFEASLRARHCFGLPYNLPVSLDAVSSTLHPADRQLCLAQFRQMIAEGGDLDGEFRAVWADGSVHWLHVMGRAACAGSGGARRLAGAVRDITEQKSMAALKESAGQMRLFVEQAPVAIAMFDTGMRYLAASQRWIKNYKLNHRGLIGRSHYELFPDFPQRWHDVQRRAMAGEVIGGDGDPVMEPGGQTHWLRWEVRPWRAANGSIGGIVIFTEDVTARVEAERALRESREDLNRAQAVARTGSWRLNLISNELSWSAETYRMFGIAEGTALTYESFLGAVHPDDRDYVDRKWAAALAGAPYDIEHRIVVKNKTKWVRERAELEFDAGGKLLGGFGTVQDISDRKLAEDEVLRLQRLMQLMGERAADAIFLTDEEGRITYANPEAGRTFGFEQGEMLGHGLHDLLHHHYADGRVYPADDCPMSKIQKTGATVRNHEDVFFRKDGSPIEVSCSYAPLDQEAGSNGGVYVARDISAQKTAQAALRESEERLRLSNEAAGIGTFTVDLKSNRALYSPELAAMLGFSEITSTAIENAFARVHRDDVPRVRAQYEAGLRGAGGGQIRMDFRFVRPGGEVRWMTWNGRVDFRNEPGGRVPFRIVGACLDITERKRAEEATAQLAAIVTSSSDAILGKTLDGTVTSWNEGAERLFGYTAPEMLGRSIRRFIPAARQREEDEILARAAGGGDLENYETVRLHKSGRPVEVSISASPIRNPAGKITGVSAIVRDITERKRHDEKVQLLLREVNHRSKNMLALVQAIASRTAAPDHGEFMKRFSDRLSALAASQDLLVSSGWQGVEIGALARSQLSHFEGLIDDRIRLFGPPLKLSASAAQAIGMAVHELATNAGKYGALSCAAGVIEIEWRLGRGEAGTERLKVTWTEHGGPAVSKPTRPGFGTTVIEVIPRMELDADVELDYTPEGVRWCLDCPADRALEILGGGAGAAKPQG